MVLINTDFTQDDKCAFYSTLISEHYSCSNATNVVRRGGSEVSCCNIDASKKCDYVYNKLKKNAITAFDVVDDDLLNMPHGVMVKIQHGGLLGINKLLNEQDDKITDISKLISDSEIKFKTLDDIPYESTIDFITSYKVRKRRK